MINYSVDDFGGLRVFKDNILLFETQDCKDSTKEEIHRIIDEELKNG